MTVFPPDVCESGDSEEVAKETNNEEQTEDCHQPTPDSWMNLLHISGNDRSIYPANEGLIPDTIHRLLGYVVSDDSLSPGVKNHFQVLFVVITLQN